MTNPDKHKLTYCCEWDRIKYTNRPPLLPPLPRMIWKVSVQGISNSIQLEIDLDNTRGKNRKKLKSKIERKSRMPKQIKCILDWNNNQRACTRQYGQALWKRTDPLEGFSFINHENKFSKISDFVFFVPYMKTGQRW